MAFYASNLVSCCDLCRVASSVCCCIPDSCIVHVFGLLLNGHGMTIGDGVRG
jgi:hypothetical protein